MIGILFPAIWVGCGLVFIGIMALILTVEDREQRREREAREQGHYPPVRTLKPRPVAPVPVPADEEPSGREDAPDRE